MEGVVVEAGEHQFSRPAPGEEAGLEDLRGHVEVAGQVGRHQLEGVPVVGPGEARATGF